jgi:P27 family predicted phage terminase small subunit
VFPLKNSGGKSAETLGVEPGLPSTRSGIPSPPSRLSAEAKSWWRKIAAEYSIRDDTGQLYLAVALEAFDRMRGAQRVVKRQGQSPKDRFGQPRAHPMLAVERDARAAMLAALKTLNLDLEPAQDRPGRPPGR